MEKLTDPRTPPAPRCAHCGSEAHETGEHIYQHRIAEKYAAPPALSNATPRQITVQVSRVLAMRDALVHDDTDEAYNQLFQMANDEQPNSDPYKPWKHLELPAAPPVAEEPAATPPHSFATDAEFQAYTSQLYEQWRNRADATEDFDEWKVAEIKRLTQATVDQYNAGRASALAELDIATRANADAHRMVDVQCAENARLRQELAPAEPPEMNWVNLRGRLSDEEAATYKAAAAEPPEARAAARKWLDENFQPHSQSGDYLRRDATDSAEYATWDLMAEYAADLQRQLDNWKANARTAREYWRSAEAANHELRRWLPISEAPRTGEHILVTSITDSWGTCGGKKQRPHAIVHWFDDAFYLSLGNQDEPQNWPTHFKSLDEADALLSPLARRHEMTVVLCIEYAICERCNSYGDPQAIVTPVKHPPKCKHCGKAMWGSEPMPWAHKSAAQHGESAKDGQP